jgi:hypothetical protein
MVKILYYEFSELHYKKISIVDQCCSFGIFMEFQPRCTKVFYNNESQRIIVEDTIKNSLSQSIYTRRKRIWWKNNCSLRVSIFYYSLLLYLSLFCSLYSIHKQSSRQLKIHPSQLINNSSINIPTHYHVLVPQ